jgi:alanine dehydrogenase
METIIVESREVKDNTGYNDLVPRIREAFESYKRSNSKMPEKMYVDVPDGDFRSMPAYISTETWSAAGMKWVNVHPNNTELPSVMAVVVLNDPETGFPLAILEGTELTGRRTGAAAAVATDRLAREDATSLGIVGAGAQAYEQLNAISVVRDIDTVVVSDVDSQKVTNFIDTFSDTYQVVEGEIEDCIDCDIVSTLTPVTEPIIHDITKGSHVNAMGADAPQKQEFNTNLLSQAELVVDDWSQCLHSGELSTAYSQSIIDKSDINASLGEVLLDESTKIQSETTLFDSTGLAIQDVAAAHLCYESVSNSDVEKSLEI